MNKKLAKYSKLSKELNLLCLRKENITRKQLSLGRIECDLLQYLNELNTAVCMNDIAEKLNVSHSRITRLIDTLEEKGLVERFASRRDRRSWLAKITPAGEETANETINDLIKIQEKLIQRFPEEEIDAIYEHLLLYLRMYNDILNVKQKKV
ncbi:MAG: MarR family transcriptional regulator [Candidatus Cloacimonetes bacterium]|nr:MarR family transcriptional regulator [Candidatus Cloacimonadota bacterium]